MKKVLAWTLFAILSGLLVGCRHVYPTSEPLNYTVLVITVVVTATPSPWEGALPTATPSLSEDARSGDAGPIVIATALRTPPTQEPSPTSTQAPAATATPEPSPTPTQAPSNTPPSRSKRLPTPVPDYKPGGGMAVLEGESPYELTILPGGWQAYQIGPSANEWGYLVDVNPRGSAPKGAYVESKILPEYFAGKWVDVLWLRAPGILRSLPVSLDLIPTRGWYVTYEDHIRLTGEWTGWSMFDNQEGCGGVLDISPDDRNQSPNGAYIANTRVQPEGSTNWVQVVRVQLSEQALSQDAWLRYYAPGPLGVETLRKKATLLPATWNGYVVANSYVRQGYVVEVIPQTKVDNEVAFSVVRPENNGEGWVDVLRVYVPEGRPPLDALLRVLAVKVGEE